MRKLLFILLIAVVFMTSVMWVLAEDVYKIEGEWCSDIISGTNELSILENEMFSGGTAAGIMTDDYHEEPQYALSYLLNIPKEGEYKMEFVATKNGSNWKYTAPYHISINDEYVAPNGESVGNSIYQANFLKYQCSVHLNEGKNNVTFQITGENQKNAVSQLGENKLTFLVDYISLELMDEKPLSVLVEAEQYDGVEPDGLSQLKINSQSGSGLSGNQCLEVLETEVGAVANGITLEYNIEAPEEGYYSISTVCGELGKPWTTSFFVLTDDGSAIDISSDCTTKVQAVKTGYQNGLFYEYIANKPVYLSFGSNHIKIYIENPRMSDNKFIEYIDYIRFDKTETTPGSVARTVSVEAESNTSNDYWEVTSNNSFSSGSYLKLFKQFKDFQFEQLSNELQLDYPFTVDRAFEYDLYLQISLINATSEYYCQGEIRLDDGQWIPLTSKNFTRISKLNGVGGDDCSKFLYGEDGASISLTEGEHCFSIRFRYPRPAQSDDAYVCYFDKIEFVPRTSIESIKTSSSKVVALSNSENELELTAVDTGGNKMTDITYEFYSSNPEVAEVNNSMKIETKNPGRAYISIIGYDKDKNKAEASMEVFVYSEELPVIVLDNIQRDENNVFVQMYQPTYKLGTATLIGIVSSTDKNGNKVIKEVSTTKIDAFYSILTLNKKLAFGKSISDTDKISIYLWNSTEPESGMIPLCSVFNCQ